jgi:hypothetical protein
MATSEQSVKVNSQAVDLVAAAMIDRYGVVCRAFDWLKAKPRRSIVMDHATYDGKPGLFLRLSTSHNGPHPNDHQSIQYGDNMLAMLEKALDEIDG